MDVHIKPNGNTWFEQASFDYWLHLTK
jgi:hypothetical protein